MHALSRSRHPHHGIMQHYSTCSQLWTHYTQLKCRCKLTQLVRAKQPMGMMAQYAIPAQLALQGESKARRMPTEPPATSAAGGLNQSMVWLGAQTVIVAGFPGAIAAPRDLVQAYNQS